MREVNLGSEKLEMTIGGFYFFSFGICFNKLMNSLCFCFHFCFSVLGPWLLVIVNCAIGRSESWIMISIT